MNAPLVWFVLFIESSPLAMSKSLIIKFRLGPECNQRTLRVTTQFDSHRLGIRWSRDKMTNWLVFLFFFLFLFLVRSNSETNET